MYSAQVISAQTHIKVSGTILVFEIRPLLMDIFIILFPPNYLYIDDFITANVLNGKYILTIVTV